MVLAAGVGSRLRPLTDRVPKALVEVAGVPMLELVIRRLVRAGADAVVVNTFHLAEQVEAFLRGRDLGAPVSVSREAALLDTGGGLKNAAWFFTDGEPFFLHNVDFYNEVDLRLMYRRHEESGVCATLAVSHRPTQRYLLFDEAGDLRGWENLKEGRKEWAGAPEPKSRRLAFNGIAVLSPGVFTGMSETGAFSIIRTYLRLAAEGRRVQAFRTDDYYYKDIGTLEKLEEVRKRAEEHGLPD